MSIQYMSPEKMIVLPDRFLAIYENISYKGVCGMWDKD